MSVALSDLAARVTAAVAARNGVPSAAQYTQAVKDAVADYSRRVTRQKRTTLSIVAGTAAYTLPDDFLFVIRMPSTYTATAGVIITDGGIVPVDSILTDGPARWYEEHNVTGLTITFYPTPTASRTQELWYAAGHVLNVSSAYADMTEDDARIALIKAKAIAMELKANAAAEESWSYSIGPESVNKAGLGGVMRDAVAALETQYEAAVQRRTGAWGERGLYDATGQ